MLEAEVEVADDAGAAAAAIGAAAPTGDRAAGPGRRPGPGRKGRSPLEGLAVVLDGAAGEVLWVAGDLLADADGARRRSARCAGADGRPLAAHEAKPLMRALTGLDVDVRTPRPRHRAGRLPARPGRDPLPARGAASSATPAPASPRATPAADGQLDLERRRPTPASTIAGRRALAVDRLVAPLHAALDAQGLRTLNDEIEVPLVGVLARMEDVGVGVDARRAAARSATASSPSASAYRQAIVEAAGDEFNVNSTPQLREVLFDELGLAPQKKTKTGFSTDAASAREAGRPAPDHRAPARATARSRSCARPTARACSARSAADGRIHATFNQTVARTGRLSSDQPNLHNIPVRSERGPRVPARRSCRRQGCELLVADYNQIELRCIAHLAEDPGLIDGFESRRDIHTETASRIFGVEPRRRHRRAAVEGEDGLLRPGLRHGGLRPRPAPRTSRPRRRPRSSTRTSWPSPACGPTWTAPSPRPASGATPRRCSAGAARSPSWRRRTSASARRASARR